MNSDEERLKKLLVKLQDDIMDEYNDGHISLKEMKKIMQWTKRIIEAKIQNPKAKTIIIDLGDIK